jgi:hypothetical protein
MTEQLHIIVKMFVYNYVYAKASMEDSVDKDAVEKLLTCTELRSGWFENLGNGNYKKQDLPVEAVFGLINTVICADLTGDYILDLLVARKEYQADIMTGRYDALMPEVLIGNTK